MMTKYQIIQLAQKQNLCYRMTGGILEDCVGKVFERFVLRSFNVRSNLKRYTPKIFTYLDRGQRVMPDAVFPTSVAGYTTPLRVFSESGFLEVKCIYPGVINPSSDDYQISTMIDVLADSPAVKAGSVGQLILVTPAGVSIGSELILDATARSVALWHGVSLAVPDPRGKGSALVQIGPCHLLNVEAYKLGAPDSMVIAPKAPGPLL